MKMTLWTVVILGIIAGSLPALAHHVGNDVRFCSPQNDGDSCVRWKIQNESSTRVFKVKFQQKGGCEDVQKEHKATMHSVLLNDTAFFNAYVLKDCKYRVVFKTPNGCTGDKDRQIEGKKDREVDFEGGCGTLKVRVGDID